MPLPVAHSLIGASIVTLALRRLDRKSIVPLFIGGILGLLPDLDLVLSWGLGLGRHYHGSYTHSLLFALAAGAAVSLLRREEQPRTVAGYVGAVLSHGLLDALTKSEFGGAALFWPFDPAQYRLGLLSNYEFYPNPAAQSWWSILTGSAPYLLRELNLCLPVFILAVAIRHKLSLTAVNPDADRTVIPNPKGHEGAGTRNQPLEGKKHGAQRI